MEGPPLGPGGENITWPDQVAPRGRKASSTRKIKPQTSKPVHLDIRRRRDEHPIWRETLDDACYMNNYFICFLQSHCIGIWQACQTQKVWTFVIQSPWLLWQEFLS